MINNRPYRYEKIEMAFSRVLGLNKWIKKFAILSITIILSIEFWLNGIPAWSKFTYDFGVVVLKLSYSFFSAFIFYLLVVHLPKEKRKVKSYRILYNTISLIHTDMYLLLNSLTKNISILKIDNVTREEFMSYCELLNGDEQVPIDNINLQLHFNKVKITFNEYINFVIIKTRNAIQQILILNEIIDPEISENLTQIQDLINVHFNSDNKPLVHLSYGLFQLYSEEKELIKKFDKNYQRYSKEYHHFARKKNSEKIRVKNQSTQ